ncbi:hypothetical protein TPHA_0G02700 [Tetrapisispora phaffii CBS 4417]|uniref:Bromo domain-containing protein n=1 Tax=Tetrapisispora phaffii (strain ATCC 24235 / CBS 4417 / NBRC 1672 / NRRL Y-8282 / UCD 70-5) TaxID=1071381 RepID=G8BW29_TETPH|nr:hypothetical protein TPHA_0G02700 [Tetrapisispora phaffii CBS 4417]CCE64107.1 hypothetical protein TPHA_0G02700 [Tetrapisispora phaffii CBS 4417]
MGAAETIIDVQTVLKAASSKCKVLEESFPVKFYEKNPDKVYESYCHFIESKVGGKDDSEESNELELTTIAKKIDNNEYTNAKNGFYRLFHDIKLVCTLLIHFYPQGCRQYQIVDKFYKFSSELLLRECYKLGITLGSDAKKKELNYTEVTDLDKLIVNDFIKISNSYKVPAEETYHISTRDSELFSSIIGKSILDNRPRELPNNDFEINKIMPQTNIREEAPRLGFIAANTSNIPDPTFPPTEMMTRFLHPNWYSLPIATWLDYGDFKSWAPFFTSNNTVSNINDRGKLWLERVGYNKLYLEREKEIAGITAEVVNTDNEEVEEVEKENNIEQTLVTGDSAELIASEKNNNEIEKINKEDIKLSNLLQWIPLNVISNEDVESFKTGEQSKLITETLKKLHKLRSERKIDRYVTKPSSSEQKLYYKAKLLLREVLASKTSTNLPVRACSSFPILQANYNGSIPIVRSQASQKKRKYKK